MSATFTTRHLGKEDRSHFDCGVDTLNQYFQTQASQDVRRRVAGCYVSIDEVSQQIAGFYSISACHTNLSALPKAWQKKLPKYERVPTVLVGRLAVDVRFRGLKLGSALIIDAAKRALRSEVVINLMTVDAKDETAAQFYQHHGFQADPKNPYSLFMPLKLLATEMNANG